MASRDAVIDALGQAVAAEMVDLAFSVQAELAEAAPVDTGFLRDNFQLGKGVAPEGTVPIGSSPDVAAIADYKLGDGSLFIANNTEYLPAVNARGQHAGFVEVAIEKGLAKP